MASLIEEIPLAVPADAAWDAVRDVGAVHRRLCPTVLVDARVEPGARIVTFANGMVVRELIVSIDDASRRFAYAATGGRTTHHSASLQVVPDGPGRCRLLWITDLLPDSMAEPVRALMSLGAADIKRTLETATR